MTKFQLEWHPPGQRIVKTSAAVTLCLLSYMILGYHGESMPAEAAITAIICMQPYVHGTTENALNRLAGTLIGGFWGFLFLLIMMLAPSLGRNRLILYPLMGLGTLVALHSTILLRRPDTSCLAAIVFLCVVIAYPDIDNPLEQAFRRILDVLLGTGIAIGVNAMRLPRRKQHNKIFFLPMSSLTTDQFERFSPPVLFRLKNLYQEGAKICLMTEHAPTFQTTQLDGVKNETPMIVMDGAAIYDPNENEYITTSNMNPNSCRWLMKRLEDVSYFVCTVHRDRNCIYHHGPMSERELAVYLHLKRSPYRYYLDDDRFSPSDVVYFKIVTSEAEARRIQRELEPMLEKEKLRTVIRPQAGLEDGCSLYFYALHADMEHAQQHLLNLLQHEYPDLEPVDMRQWEPCISVKDTIHLLRRMKHEYEPVILSK